MLEGYNILMLTQRRNAPRFSRAHHQQSACPICEERQQTYLFVIHGFPVVRCPGCGLVSFGQDLERFDSHSDEAPASPDMALMEADSLTELDAARRYLRELAGRGLRTGRLLLLAPQDEVFTKVAESQGYQVAHHLTIGQVVESDDFGGPYDGAVVLYQLEKSRIPAVVLAAIHAALRPGGVLLVALPNVASRRARYFGSRWTEWRPENRFYFDPETIQLLFEKVGFDGVWNEPDRRLYTMEHVKDRASDLPHTALTRTIALGYRLSPDSLHQQRFRIISSGMIATSVRRATPQRQLCSIIVPAFNERETFAVLMDALVDKQLIDMDKEIIVVESNSTDGTRQIAERYGEHPEVTLILEERPQGKGHAVRQGLARARGDIIMIQDADLEYDLNDYDTLLAPVLAYEAPFVLGRRHGMSWKMRQFNDQPGLANFLNVGHIFFTAYLNILYGQRMQDPFTMYKIFRRDCLHGLEFECNRFDFDVELVTKLLRKGYTPLEIPVNYRSRSFTEGKKVSVLRDPLTWLWAGLKYRLMPLRQHIDVPVGRDQ